jgi:hypothetical protein
VLDRPDNRCPVRPFLHYAEPVEFPLSLGHISLARAGLLVSVTRVSGDRAVEQGTPALQLASYTVHTGPANHAEVLDRTLIFASSEAAHGMVLLGRI